MKIDWSFNSDQQQQQLIFFCRQGVADGLTYDEFRDTYPQEFKKRENDKYHYRFLYGEVSCQHVNCYCFLDATVTILCKLHCIKNSFLTAVPVSVLFKFLVVFLPKPVKIMRMVLLCWTVKSYLLQCFKTSWDEEGSGYRPKYIVGTKSFSLSCVDARDKDDWRLRIMRETGC